MRSLLLLALLLTLSILVGSAASGCAGSVSGGEDGGDASFDTGGGPADGGDAPTDAQGDRRVGESGAMDGPSDASDGAPDGTSPESASDAPAEVAKDVGAKFTIGGTVFGLSGTVVLQNNGGDNLTLAASAPFAFATPLAPGAKYAVTVLTEPASQACVVTNGTGTVGTSDVTNVTITCSNPTFTVGGNVSGLTGSGLVLQDNGGDNLPLTTAGAFTFATGLLAGSTYDVTILTQPSGQYCTVTAGSGTVLSANVTTVSVSCAVALPYTIGGMVKGMGTGLSVVLQDNLTDNLTVSANGSFTFATSIVQGHPYSVTVLTNPTGYYCNVSMGAGIVGTGNVTTVPVTCYSGSSGGCGRFTTGFTGAWSTVTATWPTGFNSGMGISSYLPAGGTDTIYLTDFSSFSSYSTSTNAYTTLPSPPTSLPSYANSTWFAGALWAITSGSVIRYDLTAGTWSTPTTGLTSDSDNQTTNDDAGNLWSYSSDSSLLEYNIAAGTTTYHTLTTPLTSLIEEPRITFDSCNGLLYIADYGGTGFYSYDPTSGTQTALASLPTSLTMQDGFCGDRSGHVFTVTNSSLMYQYTVSTGIWTAMPTGGPTGSSNSACGVGADGYLYATDPNDSLTMYRIQLN